MKYYRIKYNGNLILDETYKNIAQTIIYNSHAYFSSTDFEPNTKECEEITEEEWNHILEETTMPLTQNHPTQQEIINAEILLNQVELLSIQKNIISLLNNEGGN